MLFLLCFFLIRSRWLDLVYAFSAHSCQVRLCFSQDISSALQNIYLPSIGDANLDYAGCCLVMYSIIMVLFFSLATNKQSVVIIAVQLFCSQSKFPPRFIAHRWALPDLIITFDVCKIIIFRLYHSLNIFQWALGILP